MGKRMDLLGVRYRHQGADGKSRLDGVGEAGSIAQAMQSEVKLG